MQSIQQKFRKPFKSWTQKDKNQIEEFFLSNVFFSKFYQNKKIEQIFRICLYRKLESDQKLLLENNNRAQAIILLSGQVIVKKKQKVLIKKQRIIEQEVNQNSEKIRRNKSVKKQNSTEYTYLGCLKQFNDTLTLNSQCSVEILQNTNAQIIFIPCALYNKLLQDVEIERVEKIEHVLQKFFFRLKKKELHQLSQANCLFREFKMNNYIYRASSKPQEIFILLQGMVKLQKPGFSQQTLKQTILLSSGAIFGEKDLNFDERTKNAIATSAHVEVLTIPKTQFLKFASKAFPDMIIDQKSSHVKLTKTDENSKTSRSMNVSPQGKNIIFPSIGKMSRFHANSLHKQTKRSQSEERRQYELIKNSHMLLDIKSKAKNQLKLRNFSPKSKQQISDLIKKQKSKIKNLIQSGKFTIDNSFIHP